MTEAQNDVAKEIVKEVRALLESPPAGHFFRELKVEATEFYTARSVVIKLDKTRSLSIFLNGPGEEKLS